MEELGVSTTYLHFELVRPALRGQARAFDVQGLVEQLVELCTRCVCPRTLTQERGAVVGTHHLSEDRYLDRQLPVQFNYSFAGFFEFRLCVRHAGTRR